MQKYISTMLVVAMLFVTGCYGKPANTTTTTAPATTTAATTTTAEDAKALEIVNKKQKDVREAHKDAVDDVAAAKQDVENKRAAIDKLEGSVKNWQAIADDETNDDATRENARKNIDMEKDNILLAQQKLETAQEKLAAANAHESKLFKQIFNLAGRGKVEDPEETNKTTEAIQTGFANLTDAFTKGNDKLVTVTSKGHTEVALAVTQSGTKVATAIDNLTKEVEKQNLRIDALNQNILKLDGMNKKNAEVLADILNKAEQKKAVHAADPVILKGIADTLEGILEEMKKKPAPVAPVAPAATPTPLTNNMVPGQYYPQQCQGQNGYCVRQWGR